MRPMLELTDVACAATRKTTADIAENGAEAIFFVAVGIENTAKS